MKQLEAEHTEMYGVKYLVANKISLYTKNVEYKHFSTEALSVFRES